MNKIITLLLLVFLFSCQEEKNKSSNTHTIKVVKAHGYLVPKDSILQPKTILAGIPTTVLAGKPTINLTNLNVYPAGIPTVNMAGKPRISMPGQDTFLMPKKVTAIDSPFVAGIPEILIAKDMVSKDKNPHNFSNYGELQGLKAEHINCLLEDKFGNIWFGTNGGGVYKFDGISFTHFTEKEGLSNNSILSMLEDNSGNLWFGNYRGVTKYDGKYFTNYTEQNGLSNNTVNSIIQDKVGNLWFGTYGGISKYDGKSFMNFTEHNGLSNNTVNSIIEDKVGNIWLGSYGGVSKYDGNKFTHFTEKEGLINNIVISIIEDKNGNLWFGTYGGGISKYDGEKFSNFTEKEGLSSNSILSISKDHSGNLWFASEGGGCCRYDGKRFAHFTENEGLNSNIVYCILEDKFGNIWVTTEGGGVSKYEGKSFTHFTEKEGLKSNFVFSILEDKSGNLWVGSKAGGISKYEEKIYTHYTDKEGFCNNIVLCILEDKIGNLWFGSYGGGLYKYDGKKITRFTDKDGLINNIVLTILEDKSGNIWFACIGGGVSKFDGKNFTNFTNKEGLSNNDIKCIKEDKFGNLWFGSNGGGVTKFDGKNFTHFTEKEGLSNNVVWSILEDKFGNLWFGTNGGVCMFDGKNFTYFTEKDGVTNNVVLSILEDKNGSLWFGTHYGLSKLTQDKLAAVNNKVKSNTLTEQDIIFKNYTYTDGFLGKGVNGDKRMLQAKDGTIWIAANDRLTAMHPENMPPDTIAPNIQLTTIDLFNENISWLDLENKKDSTLTLGNGVNVSNFEFDDLSKWYTIPENLSLAYNNNYLTFNFIGITMNQPKNVKYQYILEGIDENWSALTNKTSAPYGNLPHGTYTFKVKAMNSEGYWSAPFEYKFTIRPPFWQTWWFRTLIGLIVISSIWFYIKSREKKLVVEKEKLERIVEERTAEVVEEKKIVEQKNILVEAQKHLIEEKHKEITDSINYAERIQRSFIATKEILDENLNDYFVLFKPKDVVSGDFYWASKLNNGNFALATADSTGHGVPGAIMSLLNITSLEKAIETLNNPSDILNSTRKTIIERLKKDGSEHGGKDGMDASLTVYDFKNKKLVIAAANNPVWIMRGAEVIDIKPDKMPIGKGERDTVLFTQQEIELQKGDVVYTLTDGFPDQFGGEKGKKFMSKNLRELLAANSNLPMHEQKQLLEKTFANWRGELEQVDDVCLIGVRV